VELLRRLMGVLAPSGYEQELRKIIMRYMRRYVDEVYVDKLGNLICHKKGKGPKIMLAAHMDEIGLIVKHIKNDGKIYFSTIGGIETVTLLGQYVSLITPKTNIRGVISFHELQEDGEIPSSVPSLDDIYIDAGVSKAELEKLGVQVGTYAIPFQETCLLGSKEIISGKALDDRVGCYILMELSRRLEGSKQEVYYTFTVQEEIGLYGAKTSVYEISPDWGIAVDATNAVDAGSEPRKLIGAGPTITVKDSDLIANRCLNEYLINIAKKRKIPVQLEVEEVGTTDATNIMLSRGGIPSSVVGIPVRNLHSTVGIAHLEDIRRAIELLYHFMKNPPKTCVV